MRSVVLHFKEYFTIRKDRLITSPTDMFCVPQPRGAKKNKTPNHTHPPQRKANLLQIEIQQAALLRHKPELRSRLPLPETLGSARLRTGVGVLFAHHKIFQLPQICAACPDLISNKAYLYFKDYIHSHQH